MLLAWPIFGDLPTYSTLPAWKMRVESDWVLMQVHTNIVVFSLRKACPLAARDFILVLQQHGVHLIPFRCAPSAFVSIPCISSVLRRWDRLFGHFTRMLLAWSIAEAQDHPDRFCFECWLHSIFGPCASCCSHFTCMYGRGGLRAVTHYDVSTEQCKKALEVMLAILAEPEKHARLPGKFAVGNGTPLVGPEAQTVNGY